MENAPVLTIRQARPADANAIARIFVASWLDSYPGLLPNTLLHAITEKGQATRWRKILAAESPGAVLAAELAGEGLGGLVSLGPVRDNGLGYDGEIYALHVAPDLCGLGLGRALLRAAFTELAEAGMGNCMVWTHAQSVFRFFCEAMGARAVAGRTVVLMGQKIPEIAYGWRNLALAERPEAADGA